MYVYQKNVFISMVSMHVCMEKNMSEHNHL